MYVNTLTYIHTYLTSKYIVHTCYIRLRIHDTTFLSPLCVPSVWNNRGFIHTHINTTKYFYTLLLMSVPVPVEHEHERDVKGRKRACARACALRMFWGTLPVGALLRPATYSIQRASRLSISACCTCTTAVGWA